MKVSNKLISNSNKKQNSQLSCIIITCQDRNPKMIPTISQQLIQAYSYVENNQQSTNKNE